ncbi:MAG TPA: DUF4398 domain-containing protein [Gammaproteobacteria bacterium]
MSRTKTVAGSIAIASLVLAAGCAGNQPVPAASIEQAEQRIDEAERADAQRYANRELNMAREKLLAAREAEEDGDEERAARLAEHAELDAAYALALSDNASVQEAVEEVRETLATLESELERQQSGAPSGDVDVSLRDDEPADERGGPADVETDSLRPGTPDSEPRPDESDDALPGSRL